MVEKNELYKCELCGNIVATVDAQGVPIMCCGEEMGKIPLKDPATEGKEKHIPVITVEGNEVTVNVGSVDHPMEEAHWINYIVLIVNGEDVYSKKLFPGEKPQAKFYVEDTSNISAKALCNVHGLWPSQ